MRNFLKAFNMFAKLYGNLDRGLYEGQSENLKEDVRFIFETMSANYPEFPFFISRDAKNEILLKEIDTKQVTLAQEWFEMEPKLKYENEWDFPETLDQFEEFLLSNIARTSADKTLELARPHVEEGYRQDLREKATRDSILNLYDRVKTLENDV